MCSTLIRGNNAIADIWIKANGNMHTRLQDYQAGAYPRQIVPNTDKLKVGLRLGKPIWGEWRNNMDLDEEDCFIHAGPHIGAHLEWAFHT